MESPWYPLGSPWNLRRMVLPAIARQCTDLWPEYSTRLAGWLACC